MESTTTGSPDRSRGALASLKILDFTQMLPGPFATMFLADMGADVIRIESPTRPDLARSLPPFDGDISAWHGVLNRNKRSLALNLKQPAAVEVVGQLIAPENGYDIVIEQFRPGVMERLGVGYEALRQINPRLIYCSITGFGQTGPLQDRAGHDINYLALSGIASHAGRMDSGPPPLGVQLADFGGGAMGALVGLLAAVVERHQSGNGQAIDISMYDMMVAWQAHIAAETLLAGTIPQPETMLLNGGYLYDFYKTSDGRYLAVGSLEDHFWAGFCEAIGRPDLLAPGRSEDDILRAAVKAIVAETIAARSLAEWTAVFDPLDLCVEPVLTVPEMLAHPQTTARRLVVNVPKPEGVQRQIANPILFSRSSSHYVHTGAALGQQSEQVLRQLGYGDSAVSQMMASGAVK